MKIRKRLLVVCIVIPLLVGAVVAIVTGGGRDAFRNIEKPPLSPPAWVFPVAWTILYTLMGISSGMAFLVNFIMVFSQMQNRNKRVVKEKFQ